MTANTKDYQYEMLYNMMHDYSVHPEKLPTNKSPKWVIKFSDINGGINIDVVKGAFNCYNCCFSFSRDLNGQDDVGAGLKGVCAFIMQNNPETPLWQKLFQNLSSNQVFQTVSAVRLMDSEEKAIQNVFIMSNAKIVKLENNNDLIIGKLIFETINITDYKINSSGDNDGQNKSGYNFEEGKVI